MLKDTKESKDQPKPSEEEEESPDQPEESEEEADDEGDDQPEGEESNITVEIDGQQIPLEELKMGYMRNSDYTRKTQELAKIVKDKQERVDSGGKNEYTEEEKRALQTLDKLGIAKRSEVEDMVRRIFAQQSIATQRETVMAETGIDSDIMDAAQYLSIRTGVTLKEAVAKLTSGQKRVIKKKSISLTGGTGSPGGTARSGRITVEDIRKMDPNSKEFSKVVEMMEKGELGK